MVAKRDLEREEAASGGPPEAERPRAAGGASEADLRRLSELMVAKRDLEREVEGQRQLRASMLALFEPGAREAERRVRLALPQGEVEFVVEQDANLAQGGLLWESGIVLARYLAEQSAGPAMSAPTVSALASAPRPLRVLELGCGVAALPSLVAAAALGADVVATDLPEVIPRATTGIERQLAGLALRAGAGVRAAEYVWSEDRNPPGGPFDMVLCADVLYDSSLHSTLCAAIAGAMHEDGSALLAYAVRDAAAEADFFARLTARGLGPPRELKVEGLSPGASGPDRPARSTVRLVELRRGGAPSAGPGGASEGAAGEAVWNGAAASEGLYL